MARPRGSLAAASTLAALAAATTWVAMLSWRGFTLETGRFLGPLLVLGAVVAGTGALARWWRVPGPLVFLLQVVLSGMVASAIICGSPIPVGAAWGELVGSFTAAVDTANAFAPPVPGNPPGVHPLLVAGGLACLLLVDLFACTLRRVPLAGLPLLTVYSVPISMLGGGLSWWIFALTAAGFMGMLFLHETEQLARWGRPLGEDASAPDAAYDVRTGSVRASAGKIGGVATALAVVVPLVVPTMSVHLFDFGAGTGGDSGIQVENPMLDLRRDLQRGQDIPLLQVTTDDPDPSYLRISVLNRFSDEQWSSGDRNVPTDNLADGAMPALEGVDEDIPRTAYDYSIAIGDDFSSTWLPTYAPATRVEASGDWRYDPATMDFLAGDDDLSTAGEDYTTSGVELDLDALELDAAPPSVGMVSSDYTELPTDLPPIVRQLANQVTEDAPTRFQKARALQQWFREDGGFTYDDSVELGNGGDALATFLTDDEGGRTGYCEQFAASMAVMARMIGIPARVAVGFLSPERIGPTTWEYSAHDLHAWPELFIAGAGWVRFEPTPAGRASGVPAYTTQQLPAAPSTDGPTSPSSPSSSAVVPNDNRTAGARPEDLPTTTQDEQAAEAGFPWAPVLAVLVALLVVALLLTPRLLRRSRRERRLAGGPEDAWLELRDTVLDLRLAWPPGRSPRETRDRLVQLFGAPRDQFTPDRPPHGAEVAPDAVVAVDRIVRSLELLRYSRDPADGAGSLRAEVQTCVAALDGGASRHARRAAAWWPRSVFVRPHSPRRAAGAPAAPEAPATYGGVVDHVG